MTETSRAFPKDDVQERDRPREQTDATESTLADPAVGAAPRTDGGIAADAGRGAGAEAAPSTGTGADVGVGTGAGRYRALATDYDGTLAHDGRVDADTLEALRRARASGLRLVMVTGRELDDLQRTFDDLALFDRVVAENGALLYEPATQATRVIAPEPPPYFVETLRARGVPCSVGRSIVATVEPHEQTVLAAIRDLGLEWHVIFNKGAVMVLPSGITKATGLLPALAEIGVTPEETVGVGDAENDHSFLRACGLSAAVANALPALKDASDIVLRGARGAGVRELIDGMLRDGLAAVAPRPEHHAPWVEPPAGGAPACEPAAIAEAGLSST